MSSAYSRVTGASQCARLRAKRRPSLPPLSRNARYIIGEFTTGFCFFFFLLCRNKRSYFFLENIGDPFIEPFEYGHPFALNRQSPSVLSTYIILLKLL